MIICKILKCINIKILIIEFLLILSYLLIDIAIFCLPLYYGKILEDFISGINSFNKLLIWAAITLTLVLLEIFMSFMSDRIENNIETILQKKLINDTFANANLEIDHRGSGYYGNILIDTLSKIASLFRIEVLKPLLKIIVLIVIMFIISLVNITVGLITILFIIMYFITFHLGNTYYCKSSERLSKESLENKSYVNDTLKGVNLIRNFHAKNHEV
ncbi:MAG: ABC transporter ATP-binding protein, partial [Crenarchaeota archaeon]|nr:ABC transporter ATP-binding protein [Thermoproteota archaeon]